MRWLKFSQTICTPSPHNQRTYSQPKTNYFLYFEKKQSHGEFVARVSVWDDAALW